MRGLIAIVLMVLALAGCRTKRCAVGDVVVDTTRLAMTHSAYGAWTEDSIKTKTATALGLTVEFVDGGGAVETDGHGGVKMKGVKRVLGAGALTATSVASGKTAASGEIKRVHQENGVTVKNGTTRNGTTTARTGTWWRWMLAGTAAVCVAAGVLFFVLRR